MKKKLCIIFLFMFSSIYLMAQIDITGTILDERGNSVPGTNVLIKGTTTGTITDPNGNFSFAVPDESSILVISFLGYLTEEIVVGNERTFTITLVPDFTGLDEVVVVGYGTALRKNVTTAISKVDPTDVPSAANAGLNDLLFGRAAGLQVTQQSTQPGGQIDLSIRGRGNPLIVVDGVVMPSNSLEPGTNFSEINNVRRGSLAGLNPNDIESIEVLKDGSASIYGVEAASGVILITTKKGKEGRINVNYNASRSFQQNMTYLEPLDATEYMVYYNRLTQDAYLARNNMMPFGPNNPVNVPEPYSAEQIASAGKGTNWVDEILKDGRIDNHSLSVSGGAGRVKYYFSGNYFDQVGTVKNSDMTRYNGRMDLSFELNKTFTLNTGITGSRSNYNNTVAGWQTGGGGANAFTALQAAIAYPSYLPVRDPETGEYTQFALTGNPVAMLDIKDQTEYNSLLATLSLDISIIPEMLTGRILYGDNSENSQRDFYIPSTTNWFDEYRSRGSLQYAKRQYQTMEAYMTFNNQLTDFLLTNFVAGFGEYWYDDFGFGLRNMDIHDVINTTDVGSGQATPGVNSYKNRNKKRSYFARGTFDFFDRYLLTASYRYDGYSQFFPESKYAGFPSLSVGWKISNESFLQNVEIINILKLRASIGTTGRTLPTGVAYGQFSPGGVTVSFNDGTTVVPWNLTQIDHPELTWEKTISKNVGLDFGMLHNRITLALDLFQDDVTNLLRNNANTPALSMIPSQPVNGGHQIRSGYEVSLNTDNIRRPEFRWTTSINLSHYTARWEERFEEDDLAIYQSEKDPINAIYRFETNGILQLDQEVPEWQPQGARVAGSPLFVDQNGDGILDANDVVIYDQVPKLSFGIGNTFRYKSFDLSAFLYGQVGAYRENFGLSWASPSDFLPGVQSATKDIKDVWTTENPNGTLPGAAYTESVVSASTIGDVSGVGTDYSIMRADFLRLRNLTFGYTFNMPSVRQYFSELRMYFDVQNLFVITDYKGSDPEIMAPAVKGGAAPYPMVRTYSLGVNVNF